MTHTRSSTATVRQHAAARLLRGPSWRSADWSCEFLTLRIRLHLDARSACGGAQLTARAKLLRAPRPPPSRRGRPVRWRARAGQETTYLHTHFEPTLGPLWPRGVPNFWAFVLCE
eukprot:COSAG01_NODE_1083_length_11812_cov_9.648510_5_plen_115_part_00